MIELRWVVSDKTSTEKPVLQWRERAEVSSRDMRLGGPPVQWGPWQTVPTVAVPENEFQQAASAR